MEHCPHENKVLMGQMKVSRADVLLLSDAFHSAAHIHTAYVSSATVLLFKSDPTAIKKKKETDFLFCFPRRLWKHMKDTQRIFTCAFISVTYFLPWRCQRAMLTTEEQNAVAGWNDGPAWDICMAHGAFTRRDLLLYIFNALQSTPKVEEACHKFTFTALWLYVSVHQLLFLHLGLYRLMGVPANFWLASYFSNDQVKMIYQ